MHFRFVGAALMALALFSASVCTAQDSAADDVSLSAADGSDAGDVADSADDVHDGEAGHDHDADGHDADDSHEAAAHGDDHAAEDQSLLGFDMGSALVNLLIFLFVFAILSAFVWPNILNGLKAREDKIRSDLLAAENANAKANSLLQEYQVKLDETAQQVQSMLADARHDAEATGQRIVDEAKQEATRQQERALADIETAKQVAVSEIAGQTSDLALQLARGVVGRELNPQDHSDLIRQSLDKLPSSN